MLKVIKFGASWCGPCKALTPVFEAVSKEMDSVATFEERDVEEFEDDAVKYQIKSVPTIIFLNEKDEVVSKLIGTISKDVIVNTIQWLIENTK